MIWLIVCIISLETDFVVSTTIDAYLGAKIIGKKNAMTLNVKQIKALRFLRIIATIARIIPNPPNI